MFYCDDCASEYGYPETWLYKSSGKCECCHQVAVCNDFPSSRIAEIKEQQRIERERAKAIESIRQAHEEG